MKIKTMILAALSTAVLPVAVPLPAYTASATTSECMVEAPGFLEASNAPRPPRSASYIVQMNHLLWLDDVILEIFDSYCGDEDGYAEYRAGIVEQRAATLRECRKLVTDPALCRPVRYSGPSS